MSDERNCGTCAHRESSPLSSLWRCSRTGFFCDTEVQYGRRCAQGGELKLWAPRPPLHRRIIRIFTGVKA